MEDVEGDGRKWNEMEEKRFCLHFCVGTPIVEQFKRRLWKVVPISSGLLSLKRVLQSATGRVYGHLELFHYAFPRSWLYSYLGGTHRGVRHVLRPSLA